MRSVAIALLMAWVLGCGGTSKQSASLTPPQKAETAAETRNPAQTVQTPVPEPSQPPPGVDVAPNEFGLRCYGKPAASRCRDPARYFSVDEHGNAIEDRFEGQAICGKTILHGCDDERGKEVVPFIHRTEFGEYPAKFFPSGFALVDEAYGTPNEGGWFYINATYTKRLKALNVEGFPDIFGVPSPESDETILIGRYMENVRIGFLDLKKKGILTPAKFSSAFGFWGDGVRKEVLVCEDCHPERWGYCAPKEAHCSGNAYVIGRDGKRLKKQPDKDWVEYWWCKAHPGRKDFEPGCQ